MAVLAVLKTGAAYLPIDPALPAERVRQLLADAGPVTLVTTTGTPVDTTVPLLPLDDPGVRADLARRPAAGPARRALPESPAYAIFTSGSTGRPKGVVVPHANVVRLFTAPGTGSASAPTTCGRCSTPTPSTSRCGSCGARCCTAAGS
ncbi:hypothetical protein GCM10017687_01010 [Streptomyces echinatus]